MKGFATTTEVSVEKTRAEIETTLKRYGADQFVSGWDADRAYVMFRCKGRVIRFALTMPSRTDRSVTHHPQGRVRAPQHREAEYEQQCRTCWRRLLLCIKAKLESVETGIETFEEAFLAQIVLPDQSTVGQWSRTAIAAAYATREMPRHLLALGSGAPPAG